jgi:NADH:ubiquinone oxidoreductase subunit F (NADH-binding)
MTLHDNPTLDRGVEPPIGVARLFRAGRDASHHAHTSAYGPLRLDGEGNHLARQLELSGLTGRGGAGFPAARKVGAAAGGRSSALWASSPVVIANGAEGEPRSVKDHTLLRNSPHLVIDGLLAAAAVVNASKTYIYTTRDLMPRVHSAISERRDARRIIVAEAPESFISGEASAVVNSIENGIALPKDRTERLTTTGLKGRPTLVHNVETLAHVGLIARFGADWFRSQGTDRDPGTRLVTLSGHSDRERVIEVPGDIPITDILRSAEVSADDISAALIGGYHGAWITGSQLQSRMSAAGLAAHGAHPGAGIIYVLDHRHCGLRATAEIVRYLSRESARQCGPCRFGLPEMAELLERLAGKSFDKNLRRDLEVTSRAVVGRGSCHHPDGTSRLVLNALETFSPDVQAHLSGRCLHDARR